MGTWLTLTRREAGALFLSPSALFTAAFFSLMYGFAFHLSAATNPVAAFDDLALFVAYLSLFLAPLVTMRSFADETATGSLELLLTVPVRPATVVLAKFSGTYLFFLATIAPCAVFALLLGWTGRLDWGATAGAFAALALAGGLFVAAGLLASALTGSVIAAAAAACGGLLFVLLLEEFDPGEGPLEAFANAFGFVARLRRLIGGEISSRDLLYFVLFAGWLLFLTWLALGGRGGIGRLRRVRARGWLAAAGWLWFAAIILGVGAVAWLHIAGRLDPAWWRAAWGREGLGGVWFHVLPLAGSAATLLLGVACYVRAGRAGAAATATMAMAAAQAPDGGAPDRSVLLPPPRPAAPPPPRDWRRRKATALGVAALSIVLLEIFWLSGRSWKLAAERAGLPPLALLEPRAWDWSDDGRNTLPPELAAIVARVAEPLTATVFFSADTDYQQVPLPLLVRQLLDRCVGLNPLFRVRHLDPFRDPDRAAAAAAELGLDLDGLDHALALEYEGRKQFIASGTLLKSPPPEARMAVGEGAPHEFNGEPALATALLRLIDPRVTRVGFLQGRGELSLAGGSPNQTQTDFFNHVRRLGFAARPLTLAPGQDLPHDCDVLVMAGTRGRVEDDCAEAIEAWLAGGGRLLYLHAPPSAAPPGPAVPDGDAAADGDGDGDGDGGIGRPFMRLLRAWGGRPRGDLIQDPVNCEDGQASLPLATFPFATGREAAPPVAVLPRPAPLRDEAGRDGWRAEPYLATAPASLAVARTSPAGPAAGGAGARPRPGPFTVAYRSWREGAGGRPEGRVAVVGSAEALSNAGFSRGANQDVFTMLLLWLAGRDEMAEVAERPWVDRQLKLSQPQRRAFGWVAFGLLPLSWSLAGALAWWTRRQ